MPAPPHSRDSGAPSGSVAGRYDRLDALRGFALVWMAVFHFCFDLSTYRLLDANFDLQAGQGVLPPQVALEGAASQVRALIAPPPRFCQP